MKNNLRRGCLVLDSQYTGEMSTSKKREEQMNAAV